MAFELIRQEDVVGVEARHPLAAGFLEAAVARRGDAPVCLGNQADPTVAAGIALRDGAASIRRAVIDDQQLEVSPTLGQDTLDRLRQIWPPVMDGYDDGDIRGE